MQRRYVLLGLVTGSFLFSGCNSGDNGEEANTTTQSLNGAGTPLTPGDSPTSSLATSMAETTRETATQPTTVSSPLPSTDVPSSTVSSTVSTSTSPSTPTVGLGTTTGSIDINLSQLETYTNDAYSYTIRYPKEWEIDDADPREIQFTPPSPSSSVSRLSSSLGVYIEDENVPSSTSLDRLTTNGLRDIRQYNRDQNIRTEVLKRGRVMLPNEHPGVLFEIRTTPSGAKRSSRTRAVTTLVSSTFLGVRFSIPEATYTSTLDQQMNDILTSLTVNDDITPADK